MIHFQLDTDVLQCINQREDMIKRVLFVSVLVTHGMWGAEQSTPVEYLENPARRYAMLGSACIPVGCQQSTNAQEHDSLQKTDKLHVKGYNKKEQQLKDRLMVTAMNARALFLASYAHVPSQKRDKLWQDKDLAKEYAEFEQWHTAKQQELGMTDSVKHRHFAALRKEYNSKFGT